MATNEFIVRKGLIVNGSGSTVLDIQGSQGQLFSVTDDLTGTLFSVNDISGIPILSVDSDDTVTMGTFGENTLVVTGSNVGIGTDSPSSKLHVTSADANTVFLLGNTGTGGVNWGMYSANSSSPQALSAGDLLFRNASSNIFVLQNDGDVLMPSGNVGIGTTSPSYELDVRGSSADSRIYLDDGATGAEIYLRSNGSGEAGLYISSNSRITRAGGDLNIIANAIDMNLSTDNGSTNHLRIDTSGNITVNNDLFVNDYARIDALRVGTTSTDPGDGNLYVEGTSTLGAVAIHSSNYIKVGIGQGMRMYNQDNDNHGIFSQNSGGGGDDDIRINSYGAIYLNLDSNNNNGSGADFSIARHGGTGTLSDYLFKLDGETGRVGIGTTSPSEKLEVAGNAILDASNANLKIKAGVTGTKGDIQWTFNSDSTVYASAGIEYDNRGSDGFLIDSGYPITLDYAASYIRFSNNGSEKMRLDTSGNLGIGTTSPIRKLHIDGGSISSDTPTVRISSTDSSGTNKFGIEFYSNTGADIRGKVLADNNGRVYIDDNGGGGVVLQANGGTGNVGIGTTSPTTRLTVYEPNGAGNGSAQEVARFANTASGATSGYLYIGASSGTDWLVGKNVLGTSGGADFQITTHTSSPALTINSSTLNVGIGNTSPGETLTVGDGSADTSIAIKKSDNNVPDHLQFFNGTTRVGEIGTQDDTWLRINQVTAKNIYTPRYIRADGGFFVDNTTYGINGSGRLLSNSLSGTYSNNIGFSGGIDVYGTSPAIKARGSDSEVILQSTNESAGNPNQFYIQHNFGNVDIGNNRGNITFNNGNITITNDLFVDDYARIDALRIGTTSTDPGDGNLYVEGNSQHVGTVGYTSFNSGFGGDGWRIDQNANAEFENLTVRGTFSVYELLAQQVRATNGSLLVATSGKVDSSTGTTSGTIFFDTGSSYGHGFLGGDILIAQRLDPSGTSLKRTFVRVDSRLNAGSLSYTKLNGDNVEAGQEFVRIGNTGSLDRQGHIYLTADDSNAPYIGVRDGVSAYTDFTSATGSVEKVRVGRLDGVTSTTFSTLSGYGLWASGSVYLEGGINATFGKIADLTITSEKIHTGTGTFGNSNTPFFVSSSGLFSLGNKFSWNGSTLTVNGGGTFSGALSAASGTFTGALSGGTISIGTGNSIFKADTNGIYLGNATFASAPFRVTPAGALTATNATISGNITATTGTIGGFTIGSNTLTTTNFTIGDSTQTHAIAAGSSNQFTVTHAGAIGATSGEIAGWTLGTSTLSKNNVTLNSAGSISVGSGNNIFIAGSSGIQLGHATFNSAPFRVTQAGALTATSATITGAITAESGFIGTAASGFTINSSYFANGKSSLGDANAGVYVGTDGISLGASSVFKVEDDGVLTATSATITGAITATNITATTAGNIAGWTIGATSLTGGSGATTIGLIPGTGIHLGNAAFGSSPFRVTNAGVVTATSGEIAGWTLGATTLSKNNVTLNSGGSISVGSGDNIFIAGSSGIQLGNATFSSAPFRVTQGGALTATNATISGNITATSGTIGGWTVGSTLSATNILLDPATPRITLGAKTSLTDGNTGAYIGTDGLALGASSVFKVTDAGVLTATSATITGAITATNITATTAGNIGGWSIGSNRLNNGNVYLSNASNEKGLFVGDGAGAPYRLQVGDFGNPVTPTSTTLSEVSGNSRVVTDTGTKLNVNAYSPFSFNFDGTGASADSGNVLIPYSTTIAEGDTVNASLTVDFKYLLGTNNGFAATNAFTTLATITLELLNGTTVLDTASVQRSSIYPQSKTLNVQYYNSSGTITSGNLKLRVSYSSQYNRTSDPSTFQEVGFSSLTATKDEALVSITNNQALFYQGPNRKFEWTPGGITFKGGEVEIDKVISNEIDLSGGGRIDLDTGTINLDEGNITAGITNVNRTGTGYGRYFILDTKGDTDRTVEISAGGEEILKLNRYPVKSYFFKIIGAPGDADLAISDSTTEVFRIDSGGKVGIGTTNPSYRLHVDNDSNNTDNPALYVKNPNGAGNGTYNNGALIAEFVGDSDSIQLRNIGGGDYFLGNSQQGNGIFMYDGTGGVQIAYNGSNVLKIDSSGGAEVASGAFSVGVAPSTTAGRIDASNDVVAFSSSDKRLKQNIIPISNSLSKIEKISGVEFDWKPLTEEERKTIHGFEGHDVGVIAQEIEEVLPEVVTERDNGYKAVKYEKIVPLLIEGIKELKSENNTLRKELEDIKKILKL